ncbi:MAG: hypothetical protein J0M12_08700 [Deltaproteobacteria bacterium]|nr:hypothetical protein [Deltaproteobacteria bacterium]
MVNFTPLTATVLATLQPRQPIFFRGPDGELSVEHYVLDGPNRKFGRTVTLGANDGEAWKFDPLTVKVGDTVFSKSGAGYNVSACTGEGTTIAVTADFEGVLTDEKLPLFSVEAKEA